MRTVLAVITSLLVVSTASAAPPATLPAPPIPDTPAGHALQAWLDAFNSGDRARIEAYCKQYEPPIGPDRLMMFRKQTGGFELVEIRASQPRRVAFRLKEKGSPTTAVGKLELRDGEPTRVATLDLRAIPPGMRPEDMDVKVDAAMRTRILDNIVARLTEFYVYADGAKKMVDALRAHQKKGEYDAISDGDAFASLLTQHLQAVSHDGHLRVDCVPEVLPKEDPREDEPVDPGRRAFMERRNCGFEKAERLEGNVGYIKFNFFGDPSVCGPTATAALGFVANVDALVFDLRDNGGGDPHMVAFVASYLFGARTHLNDIYERKANKTTEYWTMPDVPGKKIVGKPVYVLTSKGTFSGGEEFTYDLKTQRRATIVGETTGGGAHPTMPKRVDDHFAIGVPFARAINPITKKDWEGTGVEPDVKVPADRALEVALKLAAEAVAKQQPPPRRP